MHLNYLFVIATAFGCLASAEINLNALLGVVNHRNVPNPINMFSSPEINNYRLQFPVELRLYDAFLRFQSRLGSNGEILLKNWTIELKNVDGGDIDVGLVCENTVDRDDNKCVYRIKVLHPADCEDKISFRHAIIERGDKLYSLIDNSMLPLKMDQLRKGTVSSNLRYSNSTHYVYLQLNVYVVGSCTTEGVCTMKLSSCGSRYRSPEIKEAKHSGILTNLDERLAFELLGNRDAFERIGTHFLKQNLRVDNVLEIMKQAHKHDIQDLADASLEFLRTRNITYSVLLRSFFTKGQYNYEEKK